MTNLISPGVNVQILDDSFYVSGTAATVPLIFVATADEKFQADGVTPALGTFEHGILRTVTSIKQAIDLYGVPFFRTSADGLPNHGDCRNEYGLDALAKVLEVNGRAYVIRANVNLNDNLDAVKELWDKKISEAADYLNSLVTDYLVQYNDLNGYVPANPEYKTSVSKLTVKTLIQEALSDVFSAYSFSKDAFAVDFLEDHTIAQAGYQDVLFTSGVNYIQGNDPTGLEPLTAYGAQISVVSEPVVTAGVVGTSASGDAIVLGLSSTAGIVVGSVVTVDSGSLTLASGTTVLSKTVDSVTLSANFGGSGTTTTLTFTGNATNVNNVYVTGADAVNFTALVARLNAVLGASATAALIQGRIRIQSTLTGATSEVEVLVDGPTGRQPLFASCNLFNGIATKVAGKGILPLDVYDADYTTLTGGFDGLYSLVTDWSTGDVEAAEFTAAEAEGLLLAAAADFDNTKEFKTAVSLGTNDAARRLEVVKALQAAVNNPYSNARSEALEYNIAIVPGFPELSDELLRLGQDMFEEVFLIGETPFDKPPVGPNSIANWAVGTGRSTSEHIGYWYGHGLTSNVDGATILTSAGTTALRVLAYSDANSEGEWIAPAGPTRGVCPHLTDVGYVSGALGGPTTFVRDWLDNGTRDELYEFPKNINPITFIPGRGFLVMGQKTTSATAKASDRVNVSRLLKYIKRQLRKALFSYTFEPNDEITRRNVKASTDNFLATLIDRRGLYDFATICDEDNNSNQSIDANELNIDIAIKPVKAVEFINARIRVVRTSANIGTKKTVR